jgi:PilZ domain
MAWSKEWDEGQSIAGDRRLDRRYRIQLDLRWKLIRRRKLQDSGSGRTIDLSSGGILFEAERPLPVGMNVELSVAWPVLLERVAPIQLTVSGRIVRAEGRRVGVRITQHEFRTMGGLSELRDSRLPGVRATPDFRNGTKQYADVHPKRPLPYEL